MSQSFLITEDGFSCEDGEVKLLEGQSMYEGRVEVCFNNKFSTVCDRNWDINDATVVCNQLNFTVGGSKWETKLNEY